MAAAAGFAHPGRLCLLLAVFVTYHTATLVWRWRLRPKFQQRSTAKIVFQERRISGASQKNFFTQLSGAQRCLTVTLTETELWTQLPSFLLAVVPAGGADLEHRIPVREITHIGEMDGLTWITFRREPTAKPSLLALKMKNGTALIHAVKHLQAAA